MARTEQPLRLPNPRPPVSAGPRATYRWAMLEGFSREQAANLTAIAFGLHCPELRSSWTIKAVCHLIFLRSIATSGRLSR